MFSEPVISLDRQSKRIACFDGFELVRDFQDYQNEAVALQEAHNWFKTRTIHVPQVKFPKLKKVKFSS